MSKRKGIMNLKNTCFMNSIFQVLITIPEFCEKISQFSSKLDKTTISYQLSLIINQELRNKEQLKPFIQQCFDLFKYSKPFTQQDASEFFLLLIEKICNELKEIKEDEKIIEELFKGEIVTENFCTGKNINLIEQFLQLDLEIFDIEETYMSKRSKDEDRVIESIRRSWTCGKEQPPVTILDCIRKKFKNFAREKVDDCLVCKGNCNGVAEAKLVKSPQYLFLLIKRYKFDGRLKKINRTLKLLNEISIFDQDYELISIVRHSEFLGRKHFRAYCKDKNDWVECDDEKIKRIDQKTALDIQPYFILYKKKENCSQKTEISSLCETHLKINQNQIKYQLEEIHIAEGGFNVVEGGFNVVEGGLNVVGHEIENEEVKLNDSKVNLEHEESKEFNKLSKEKEDKVIRTESHKIIPLDISKDNQKLLKSCTLKKSSSNSNFKNKVAPISSNDSLRYSVISNKTEMSDISFRQGNIDTSSNIEPIREEVNFNQTEDFKELNELSEQKEDKVIRAESHKFRPLDSSKDIPKLLKSCTLKESLSNSNLKNKVVPISNNDTVRYSILSSKTDLSEISLRQVNIDTSSIEPISEEVNASQTEDFNNLHQDKKIYAFEENIITSKDN